MPSKGEPALFNCSLLTQAASLLACREGDAWAALLEIEQALETDSLPSSVGASKVQRHRVDACVPADPILNC